MSEHVLEAFFLALCRSSIIEAFFFSRSQDENVHHRLFHKLIHFVHTEPKDGSKPAIGATLISLPLNETEEAWFVEYLKDGQGDKLPGARDTLVMRGLIKGDLKAIQDIGDNVAGGKIHGVNWTVLKEGLKPALRS